MDQNNREEAEKFTRLLRVVRELRLQCPWDREQTIESLAKHLLEEAYEALDEIERGDAHALAIELGDLLSQILFITVIAEESERFSIAAMLSAAADKLIRRHPHIYPDPATGGTAPGDAGESANLRKTLSVAEVLETWSRIKEEERRSEGKNSALDGIARAMPALMRAEKLGVRARQAGMDWPNLPAVLAKVREELAETEEALARGDHTAVAAELGDLMLALANAPRFVGHEAEETLRKACDKFVARFSSAEQLAAARGLELKRLSNEQLDSLWQEAKRVK
ncbi:MAG: nucleoside triphosphate pyrophosphohydrolase [Candidatus Binataceae bacterium]